MRKTARSALLLTVSALLLTACGSGDAPAAPTGPAKTVKVLTIGYPDEDGIDPTTGGNVPGISRLKQAFTKANPGIELQIINIPWGSGSTGYAPKTEAMMQAGEACLYEMPAAQDYGRQGKLVNLDTLIDKDPQFKNVWGKQLEVARSWGPDNPKSLFYIPNNTGERVINWDAKLFADFGVEPLSAQPTLQEIETKAAKLTGINPRTGQQSYGYWYQGKYAVWQFMAIGHAMGADWGSVGADGKMHVNWNTPEYLKALEWFVEMSRYAPDGALAGDGMPQGFLTDQNVVGIIPDGEPGYFLLPLIDQPEQRSRFRTSYNVKGADGRGGLSSSSPLAMAASCTERDAAWTALKWLAGSPESQQYYFDSIGRLPSVENGDALIPKVAELPDAKIIIGQTQTADPIYPWAAGQPRWAMQTALEAALAKTITPKQALEQAQKETDAWLATQ